MNIIYMHTHDTGRFIEPYGHGIPTPHLKQMADEGTLFRQAYNAGPTCSPSRAGLVTGLCAHSSGMTGLAHRGFALADYSQHMASYFSSQGFETVLSGVQHEASYKRVDELGYTISLKSEEMPVPENGDHAQAAKFMQRDKANAKSVARYLKTRDSSKPFFLSFGPDAAFGFVGGMIGYF